MPTLKYIDLSAAEQTALEKSSRYGATYGFRQRCQMVLLKSERLTSAEVAKRVGCCEVVVNTALQRYVAEGLAGLQHKKGGGRRPILQQAEDLAAVRRAVEANRQRASLAKGELEKEVGKSFSTSTLKRFLKKTVVASNECENG